MVEAEGRDLAGHSHILLLCDQNIRVMGIEAQLGDGSVPAPASEPGKHSPFCPGDGRGQAASGSIYKAWDRASGHWQASVGCKWGGRHCSPEDPNPQLPDQRPNPDQHHVPDSLRSGRYPSPGHPPFPSWWASLTSLPLLAALSSCGTQLLPRLLRKNVNTHCPLHLSGARYGVGGGAWKASASQLAPLVALCLA